MQITYANRTSYEPLSLSNCSLHIFDIFYVLNLMSDQTEGIIVSEITEEI